MDAAPPASVARLWLARFVPGVALLALLTVAASWRSRERELAFHRDDGRQLVDALAELVAGDVDAVRSDLLHLAERGDLLDLLAGRPGARARLEASYRSFCARKGVYDQLRYLDEAGMEVVRVNRAADGTAAVVPAAELQSKAARYYVDATAGLRREAVYVSPLDLNIERGRIETPHKPVIRFATPVFDETGRRRGILVLNYLGQRLIDQLVDASRLFAGRFLLLDGAGHWLHGAPRPEDAFAFMFGRERTFGAEHPEAWRRIRAAPDGEHHGGEGLFTARTVDPGAVVSGAAPSASADVLRLVAWTPPATLEAESRRQLRTLLALDAGALVALALLAGALARATAHRRRAQTALLESEKRLRALSRRLLAAQEDERVALSRDLHDDLGQLLTVVALDLDRARRAREGDGPEAIERARDAVRSLLDSVHDLATRLRAGIVHDLGLAGAVRGYAADFEAATGVRARLRIELDDDAPIGAATAAHLFRIAQEALGNAAEHAGVAEVELCLLPEGEDRVTLRVRDEGVGFDPDAVGDAGLGIVGMRERVELMGGRFTLRSAPLAGTTVEVGVARRSAADA